MLALEVEYLLGRVFAGDFRDRSESEWPPHPARLYSALASAYFEGGGGSEEERAALEWLERMGPPLIHAGEPGQPSKFVAFVPTNYPGDSVPTLRLKQPRVFPGQGPSESIVHFIWPQATPDEVTRRALDALASRTAYLGKACSLVRMRVAETAPDGDYVPNVSGKHILRVPNPGRLSELARSWAGDQRPSMGEQVRYQRRNEEPRSEPVCSEFGQMVMLRKTSGPGLPVEATLTVTDALRTALLSISGDAGPIRDALHGHGGDTHCAYLALPYVGFEHADGHLMGVTIALPRSASVDDRRAVWFACGQLQMRGLHIPGVGDWSLEAVDAMDAKLTLRPVSWANPSKTWQTVTPILLDRFPKRKGPSVEEIIVASCARIGLPVPTMIEHSPYSKIEGVPPVPAFRLVRRESDSARWGVHARIVFECEIRGPVLLGAGRYFGLGLLRPERRKEEGNDAEQ